MIAFERLIHSGRYRNQDYYKNVITVDNLEVAQFIHLLINNKKIRQIIDTITSKVVLILGNFSPDRMIILESIRDQLRARNYIPVLFDFVGPNSRDLTETISTIAHMCRFIIADLTSARSVAHELASIVPSLPSVPVQPILLSSDTEYAMFEHLVRYSWVLPVYKYEDESEILADIDDMIIGPAEKKTNSLIS